MLVLFNGVQSQNKSGCSFDHQRDSWPARVKPKSGFQSNQGTNHLDAVTYRVCAILPSLSQNCKSLGLCEQTRRPRKFTYPEVSLKLLSASTLSAVLYHSIPHWFHSLQKWYFESSMEDRSLADAATLTGTQPSSGSVSGPLSGASGRPLPACRAQDDPANGAAAEAELNLPILVASGQGPGLDS